MLIVLLISTASSVFSDSDVYRTVANPSLSKAVESINKDGGPNFKKTDKILMAAAEKTYNKKELDKFDLMSIYKRLEEIELRLKQLEKK